MKKTLLTMVAILFTLNITASAQSALDGFDPNANGAIRVIVVQPDGKVLIGGEFTTLSPNGGAAVTRNHIARLNPDGTLDTAFDPNANNFVLMIAVQADGKVLAGGTFSGASSIGGATRNSIARLDAVTGAADSWDPNANGFVQGIAVQTDGKILAGGAFTTIGGASRNRIARLDAVTGLADSFNPSATSAVRSIVVQGDGKILACGDFTGANSIGGATRNFIARLDVATGLVDSFDPNANSFVRTMAVQADGKVLAGGDFTTIGGQTRNSIARLDAVTGLADSFNSNANNFVRSIAVQTDGKILVGGDFTGANSIGGQTRNFIARLDAATGLADSFDPNANSFVRSIAVQTDGKILAGGFLTTVAPNGGATVTRNNVARFEANGVLDRTLDLGIVGSQVNTIAVQPDGKILIAGVFSAVLGVPRNNIARLNADGTLDTAFDPNSNSTPYAIAVQKDGKILVCGVFTNIGGQPRNRIARLTAVTGAADTFDPNSDNEVDSITVQPDGNILASGFFTNIGGQPRNRIARLDATSGLADSFNPNANGRVYSIAVQADGKIVAGGQFSSIGGATRNYLARLDATTGLADSFDPNGSGPSPEPGVYAVVVQADGKILACGRFSTIGGQTRNNIARLDAATGLADSWDPNAAVGLQGVYSMAVQADGKVVVGFGGGTIGGQTRSCIARLDGVTGLADSFDPNSFNFVYALAVQADGKILAGGAFSGANSIGGQTRNYFARLSNDTAALQNLVVTPTTVTWTRGGSSPQFNRVTFESSTDNVNFTPLGNGTVSGSNWTLTGLSLPTNQNFYIRARGFYRGSFLSASESMTESVRNGFFGPPAITSANGATFTVGAAGTFTVTTTGIPGGSSMAISKSGALPSGMTFVDNNNGTATFAGTPNAGTGGSYPVTITANNGVAPNGTQSFTLILNESPRINSANNATFTVGFAGTFTVTTDRGFPAPPLSKSGALPSGVTFTDNGNGTATLAGTPGPGTSGSYPITITANNGVAPNANQSFTLMVDAATAAPATISGLITRPDGTPLSGALVILTGSTQLRRAISDAAGGYVFRNVDADGFYTVTPARANYIFSPGERSFSLVGNKTDAVFTASQTMETANPLDTPEFFVRQQYLDFLNREPDQEGLDYWSGQLRNCETDQTCLSSRRLGVSAAFFVEQEFRETGSFVYRLYKASFGRQPNYGEFSADRVRVIGGPSLAEDQQALADEWVSREPFKQHYPDSLGAAEFVHKIFETAGLQAYDLRQQQIDAMTSTGKTRAQVVRDVIEITEFKTREYNPSFVLMQYFGYLHRDAEAEGYTFWLEVLNDRQPNNYRGMVCSFVTAAEYQNRFSSVVTHSNAECGR